MVSDDAYARPSKSARKREHAFVQKLVREIAGLSTRQRATLPLDDDVRSAIDTASRLKRQAFERQVRHASGLLARTDWQAVADALERLARPHHEEVRRFHQLEQWRDRLLAGEAGVFDELVRHFGEYDRAELSRLVGAARRNQASGSEVADGRRAGGQAADGERRGARAVFRFLAELEKGSEP